MRIGFISIIGERGQWHLTKNFMRALQDNHELFLLGRPFSVRDGTFISSIEDFEIKAKAVYASHYKLSPELVRDWILENNIEVVFFNEEYDWSLVDEANKYAKTVSYLDYFTEEWIPLFDKYNKVIACAEHAYNLFVSRGSKNIVLVDWGVDDEEFRPREYPDKSTFFHSAGWGGINWRKYGPDVLKIFDAIREEGHKVTMTYHSQTAIDMYDEEAKAAIARREADGSLRCVWGNVKHPGLYHTGRINVAPSRLEGLGLYLPEGLACGLPTITTDAPPMNQFVKDGYNGRLVRVTESHQRKDPYFFPEHSIDLGHLKEIMIELSSDETELERMSKNAREFILEKHSFSRFSQAVLREFESLEETVPEIA